MMVGRRQLPGYSLDDAATSVDQGAAVGSIVLACGRAGSLPVVAELAGRPDVTVTGVATADRAAIDPVLAELGDRRLVVLGRDADLAAVVLRVLRTDRLAEVAVGFVPASPGSEVALTWDLPDDPGRALEVALRGEADKVPLIRDDNGGVLVGLGTIGPVRGVGYCDDAQVLRGPAKMIRVNPYSSPDRKSAGLEVAVAHRGLFNRKLKINHGRAFELGCLPATVVSDGVARERAVKRWNWYRHTEDLRLIRGVA
jgi:hypothetical protein